MAMDGQAAQCERLFDDAAWHSRCVRLEAGLLDRMRLYADILVSVSVELEDGEESEATQRTSTCTL